MRSGDGAPPGAVPGLAMSAAAAPLAHLGRALRQGWQRQLAASAFLGATLRAPLQTTPAGRAFIARAVVQQVRFTAVQALPLIATLGFLVGATVILQAYSQAARFGMTADMPARILVLVVIRELGPLITALVILGRSGTAVATELGTNSVLGEIEALEAQGSDVVQLFVLPRLIGITLAAVILTIYFDVIAFGSGLLAARAFASVPLAEAAASLRFILLGSDLLVTVTKAAVLGAGIALICCYKGLSVPPHAPTVVPQAVTAAVVAALVFIFGLSTLASVLAYA
jgi:phospholipid/cholesterol/gamma-HCH transport system permease protein